MTKRQKQRLVYLRGERQEAVAAMVRAAMDAPKSDPSRSEWFSVRYEAGRVANYDRMIAEHVSDAYCGECGSHESEPCAETCGERVTEGA